MWYKVLAMILAMATALGPLVVNTSTSQDLTGKNDISVTVLDWYSDMTFPNNTYNVTFRVSFDINDDGKFENISTSGTFMNASSLARPFEAHMYVDNATPSIQFMVEVIESDHTVQVMNGSGPLHTVPNVENATDSWAYNNINQSGASRSAYYIYYAYRVSPTHPPGQVDAQTTSGNTTTFDVLPLIWSASSIGIIAIIAAVVIIIWRRRRRPPLAP